MEVCKRLRPDPEQGSGMGLKKPGFFGINGSPFDKILDFHLENLG